MTQVINLAKHRLDKHVKERLANVRPLGIERCECGGTEFHHHSGGAIQCAICMTFCQTAIWVNAKPCP